MRPEPTEHRSRESNNAEHGKVVTEEKKEPVADGSQAKLGYDDVSGKDLIDLMVFQEFACKFQFGAGMTEKEAGGIDELHMGALNRLSVEPGDIGPTDWGPTPTVAVEGISEAHMTALKRHSLTRQGIHPHPGPGPTQTTTPKLVNGPDGEEHFETTINPDNYLRKRYNKTKHQLGITLQQDSGEVVVRKLVKHSPPYNSGLREKDTIVQINHKAVQLESARKEFSASLENNISITVLFKRLRVAEAGRPKASAVKKKKQETVSDELAFLRVKAADARRKAEKRAAENNQQRKRRLLKEAQRISTSRATRTPNQLQQEQQLNTSQRSEAREKLTPEQLEQQREQNAERMSVTREKLTPEQLEQQQQLDARRRSKARGKLTPEQLEQQREQNAERMSVTREKLTPEQLEQQREQNAERMSVTREKLTPEQLEQQQQLDARRRSKARGKLTPEQLEQQREQNAERMSVTREKLTPEQLEQQREQNAERMSVTREKLTPEQLEQQREQNAERMSVTREKLTPEQLEQQREQNAERMAVARETETDEERDLRLLKDRTKKRIEKLDSKQGQLFRKAIEDLMTEYPSLKEQKDLYEYISFRKRAEEESIAENFARIKELKKEYFRKQTGETATEAVRRSEFCKLLDQYWLQRREFAPREEEEGEATAELYTEEGNEEEAARKMKATASKLKGLLTIKEGNYWDRKDIRRIRRRFEERPQPEETPEQKREDEERMEEMFELSIAVSHVSCVNCSEWKRMSAGGYAKGSQAQAFTKRCLRTYEKMIDAIDPGKYKKEKNRVDAELRKKWMGVAVEQLRREMEEAECLESFNDRDGGTGPLGSLHICLYCHSKLRSGNVPPISFYNGMRPDPIPPELAAINDLGETLIALQTPFLKLLSLPAGGQHALEGKVTNVPNDWSAVKAALRIPRNWDEGTLVGVAMKRRTEYQSDYLAMYIDPDALWKAAVWLSKNNPDYVGMNLNQNWAGDFRSQQPELADALILRAEERPCQTPTRQADVVDVDIGTPPPKGHGKDETPVKDRNRLEKPETQSHSAPRQRNRIARLSRSLSRRFTTPRKSSNAENRPPYSPMLLGDSPLSVQSVVMGSPYKSRSASLSSRGAGSNVDDIANDLPGSTYADEVDDDNLIFPIRGLELPPARVVQERRERGLPPPPPHEESQTSQPSRVVVAPAEHNSPMPFFTNEKAEEHSFPTLFTKGRFGFSWNRAIHISFVQYVRNRLKHSSNRFSAHRSYLFWAAYAYEVRRLESNISTQLRKASAKGKGEGGRVNAGALLDQETMDNYTANAQAFQVLAPMRGSPQYWNSATQDLVSMIRQLGPCTFFLTLSANDRNWKDVLTILLRMELKREPTHQEVANLSNRDRDDLVRKYKVQVAQQFYHRVQMMRNRILKSHFNPLGDIVDFWERYEMQARGSIHLHCLLWIKDAPTFGVDSDEDICKFIDKYISTQVPDPDQDPVLHNLVTTLLQHNHRPSCQKRKLKPEHKKIIKCIRNNPKLSESDKEYAIKKVTEDAQCRFSYPKAVTDKTYLDYEKITIDGEKVDPLTVLPLREAEWAAEAEKAGLDKGQIKARVTAKRKSFLQSLKVNVVYKRTPEGKWTNVHNTAILRCWKANMDLQYCVNMFTLIAYVCGYVSKPETELGELLRSYQEELDVNMPTKQKFRAVCNRLLQARKLSGQEAVMKVLGLDYKRSSRRTKFIRTGPEEERWRMKKPAKELEQMDEDDEDVFIQGLFEHYQQRECESSTVEKMPLIIFAAFYDKVVRRKKSEVDNELDGMDEKEALEQEEVEQGHQKDEEESLPPDDDPLDVKNMPDVIPIINERGNKIAEYKRRERRAIIRYFRFSPENDSEKYFLSMLQLFVPFRDEKTDLDPHTYNLTSYQDLFELRQGDLRTAAVIEQFEFFAGLIAEAFIQLEAARENRKNEDIANILAVEEGYDEDAEVAQDPGLYEGDALALDDEDEDGGQGAGQGEREQPFRGQPPPATSQDALKERLSFYKSRFNADQLAAFKDAEHVVDEYIRSRLSRKDFTGYNLFIHGPGGVGKSFVLEAIRLMAHEKTTSALKGSLNDSTTVVVAPTGCAALNVGGATLHSAFKIFVQQGRRRVDSISHKQIQRLQLLYADLHCIFIDEISMVSIAQFCSLHERLNTIMGTRSGGAMFGGIPIIAFGDLYQLPPVAGGYIWKQPPKSSQSSTLAVHPWKDCFKMRELKISERQKGDSVFAEVLNRIRVGEHTASDMELLETRRLDQLGLTMDSPGVFDLPFLFPLNKDVQRHNNLRQSQLLDKLTKELGGLDNVLVLRLTAVDRFANKEGKNVPLSLLDSITDDITHTGGCAKYLELMPGTRVMIRRNVNVEDGLVNGSCGTVHSWSPITLANGLAKFVLVKFDEHKKVKVGKQQRKRLEARLLPKDPLVVPIFPLEVTFEHEGKTVIRTQFPVAINWAQTVHKSQGQTLNKFVISTSGLKRKTCGLIYVALSRGPNLEAVHIVELDATKIKAAPSVKEEVQRLQRFSGLSMDPEPRERLPPIQDPALDDYQNLRAQEKRDRDKLASGGVMGKVKAILAPPSPSLTLAHLRAKKALHQASHLPKLKVPSSAIADVQKGLTSQNHKILPWITETTIPAWNSSNLPKLQKYCQNNAKKIWDIMIEIQSLVPRSCSGSDNQFPRPARELTRKLFPTMLDLLVPVQVEGDGDCLFRAASLSLFGTDEQHSLLRALSVFVMLLLEEYFITLAKRANWWAYSGVDFALHPEEPAIISVCDTTREQRREIVHKTVAMVWKHKTFCDLFAVHALGIKMRELKISERQKGDSVFAEVLNRIRVGEHTASDMELLETRRLDQLGLTMDSPGVFDLPFLFPLNKDVQRHNNLRQSQLLDKLTKELGGLDNVLVLRLTAVDRFANKEGKNVPLSLLDSITDDITHTGGCAKYLELMPGTRVMIRRNVNVEDGLVNGSCGTVHSWSPITLANGLAKFVLVKFDEHKKVKVGKQQRKRLEARLLPKDPLVVPIFPLEVTFEHEGKTVIRTQFPVAINWAQTVHKSQGQTLNKFVISTSGLKRKTCGLIYVALSRGPNLEAVHIVELDATKIKAAPSVKEEVQRLQRFSGLSMDPEPRERLPPIQDPALDDYQNLRAQEKRDRDKLASGGVMGKVKAILAPPSPSLTLAHLRAKKALHQASHLPKLKVPSSAIADVQKGLTSQNHKILPWITETTIPAWNSSNLPKLQKYCQNNAKKIWDIMIEIQSLVPRSCSGSDNQFPRPARELTRKLFPTMLDLLVPVQVEGDGDCLFRAASLSLFGTDEQHSLLRALSVFVMLLLEEYFITLAKRANWWAYSGVDFALHPEEPAIISVCDTTREQRREIVHKTVAMVWKHKTFCDLFAVHALGIVTGRPVYIYGNCLKARRTDKVTTTDTEYILNAEDIVSSITLRAAFTRKDPALKQSNWLLSTLQHAEDRQPIMLFNTGGQNVEHFTSLVRKDAIPAESLFRPTYLVFTEELDERMDAATRAAVGTRAEQELDLALPRGFLRCMADRRWEYLPKELKSSTH